MPTSDRFASTTAAEVRHDVTWAVGQRIIFKYCAAYAKRNDRRELAAAGHGGQRSGCQPDRP